MAIFSSPDKFNKHKDYVLLLKKALKTVKADPPRSFVYYKEYPFGSKKLPLLLVDFSPKCDEALKKTGAKRTAKGKVNLTAKAELDFNPSEGKVNRIRLQKYFTTMGGGINDVFIPVGEVDDDEDGDSGVVESAKKVFAESSSTDDARLEEDAQQVFSESVSTDAGSLNEKVAARLNEHIATLQQMQFPPETRAKKEPALKMARKLVAEGKYTEAKKLLTLVAAQARLGQAVKSDKELEEDAKQVFEESVSTDGGTLDAKVAARLNEHIATLQKMQFPPETRAQKEPALVMAQKLVADGKYPEAKRLLSLLAAQAKLGQAAEAQPSPTSPPTGTQAPKAPPRPVQAAPLNTPAQAAQLKKVKKVEKVDKLNKTFAAIAPRTGQEMLDDKSLKAGSHFKAFAKALQAYQGKSDDTTGQELTNAIDSYLKHFDKFSKADKKSSANMKKHAEVLKAQKYLQNSQAIETLQNSAKALAGREDWGPADHETANQIDAQILQTLGSTNSAGGTGDTYLIKDPDGKVAYAFKSIDGETNQSGMPKGAGAAREALMSTMCAKIKESSGLDFGWPSTTIATLKGADGKEKSGALVEGIQGGTILDADGKRDKGYRKLSQEEKDKLLAKSKEFVEKLPPKETQKLLLCNLAFGQLDIKWDNAKCQTAEDGSTILRPLDAGAAMPAADFEGAMFDSALAYDPAAPPSRDAPYGLQMLYDPADISKPLKAKDEKIDQELRDSFLKIDVDLLEKAGKEEAARLNGNPYKLDSDKLGITNGLSNANTSIRAIQKMLKENPDLTTEQFLKKYEQEVRREIAKQNQPKVFKMITDEYTALYKKYSYLLPKPGKITPQLMYKNFTSNKDTLSRLEKYDLKVLKKFWGGKTPIPDFMTFASEIRQKDKANNPKKYPDI